MVETLKRFKFGWFGDGGLGEKLIQKILSGQKTVTSCPSYDPEDADIKVGDKLELCDKHGKGRALLSVERIELRAFGTFDEAFAALEGTTLSELVENTRFANGREIRPEEEMRVVHFKVEKLLK